MSAKRDSILFLCVTNSARSQMAEGWARVLAPAGIEVFSAGSEPLSVNPLAIQVMDEVGIDLSRHTSKRADEIPAERIAMAVTLCAEEICPVFPGEVEMLHWPQEDPAVAEGDEEARLAAFRRARDDIRRRLEMLFRGPLPFAGT